jgi:hypothetical protein
LTTSPLDPLDLLVDLADTFAKIGADIKALTTRINGAVQEGDVRLTDARTPTPHRHPASDIDDLPTGGGVADDDPRLSDARAPLPHSHAESDVTGLGDTLAGKADLVDGKVPADQLPESTGGGGGAGIDDTVTAPDSTWSSEKTAGELATKAPDVWAVMDPETGTFLNALTGEVIENPTAAEQGAAVTYLYVTMSLIVQNQVNGQVVSCEFVTEIPETPLQNRLYMLRADDGTVTWHMPVLS